MAPLVRLLSCANSGEPTFHSMRTRSLSVVPADPRVGHAGWRTASTKYDGATRPPTMDHGTDRAGLARSRRAGRGPDHPGRRPLVRGHRRAGRRAHLRRRAEPAHHTGPAGRARPAPRARHVLPDRRPAIAVLAARRRASPAVVGP